MDTPTEINSVYWDSKKKSWEYQIVKVEVALPNINTRVITVSEVRIPVRFRTVLTLVH